MLETYSPKAVEQRCASITTPLQCCFSGEKNLLTLTRDFGQKKVEALVKVYLLEMNELLNLRNPLNEACIDRIASMVVKDYRNLNFADIRNLLDNGARGRYSRDGEVLMINYSIVMGWFERYSAKRCDDIEDYNLNVHEQRKREWMNLPRSNENIPIKEWLRRGRQS